MRLLREPDSTRHARVSGPAEAFPDAICRGQLICTLHASILNSPGRPEVRSLAPPGFAWMFTRTKPLGRSHVSPDGQSPGIPDDPLRQVLRPGGYLTEERDRNRGPDSGGRGPLPPPGPARPGGLLGAPAGVALWSAGVLGCAARIPCAGGSTADKGRWTRWPVPLLHRSRARLARTCGAPRSP